MVRADLTNIIVKPLHRAAQSVTLFLAAKDMQMGHSAQSDAGTVCRFLRNCVPPLTRTTVLARLLAEEGKALKKLHPEAAEKLLDAYTALVNSKINSEPPA